MVVSDLNFGRLIKAIKKYNYWRVIVSVLLHSYFLIVIVVGKRLKAASRLTQNIYFNGTNCVILSIIKKLVPTGKLISW